MHCNRHSRYRAVRKPTTGCKVCGLLWYIQRLRKALGFSHAVAKPRLVKTTGDTMTGLIKTPNFAANLAEPTEAVRAERKAKAIEFQKAMHDEDTKTNP